MPFIVLFIFIHSLFKQDTVNLYHLILYTSFDLISHKGILLAALARFLKNKEIVTVFYLVILVLVVATTTCGISEGAFNFDFSNSFISSFVL